MSDTVKPGTPLAAAAGSAERMVSIDSSLHDGPAEFRSIIDGLRHSRIASIDRLADGTYEIREACDKWYSVRLKPNQMRDLAREIIALVDCHSPTAPDASTEAERK